jgi:hypothetical protein
MASALHARLTSSSKSLRKKIFKRIPLHGF